jgi:hypothetical protein
VRRILSLVGVNAVVLAVLLLLAEAGLRWRDYPFGGQIVPSENVLGRFDETLGWSYRPNVSTELNFGMGTRAVHFDAHGIRVPTAATRLDPEAPSIVFIGGSYTMGHGLSFEESFAGQVAAAVADTHQVVNLGVQAYGTDQSFLMLQRFFDDFDVRLVVYTFIDDHTLRNATDDRRLLHPAGRFLGTKPRFALDAAGALRLADTPVRYEDLGPQSYLLGLLRSVGLRTRLVPRDTAAVTRALVRAMDRYCTERGAAFVLLNWRWQAGDFDGFDDLGIDVVDTLDAAPPEWGPAMQITGWHPGVAASEYAAGLLIAHFRRADLL